MANSELAQVVIISPSLPDANNGNGQTCQRYADFLATQFNVRLATEWSAKHPQASEDQLMIAIHANKSAESISAWAKSRGCTADCPSLIVVMSGTDLYLDLPESPQAHESIRLAGQIVVLQDQALKVLPEKAHSKTHVIYQSTPAIEPVAKSNTVLNAVMVGHMRPVKDPATYMRAARSLADDPLIQLMHIGQAGLPEYSRMAHETCALNPQYRWLGPVSHSETLQYIREAHVLVHTSTAEGGAHVILEAVQAGTPVLASRVDGNVGMLGSQYSGYFPVGDSASLATALRKLRQSLWSTGAAEPTLKTLRDQCKTRAALFDPALEKEGLFDLCLRAIKGFS